MKAQRLMDKPCIKRTRGVTTALRPLPTAPFALGFTACLLLIALVIMNALRTDTEIAEWWTTHIARQWESAAGVLTSWLPISVFELAVIAVVAAALFLFVRLIINLCRADFLRIITGICGVGVAVAYVLDLYMLSMGFGYYRAPMPKYERGADYTAAQTLSVAEYFLEDYNRIARLLDRDEKGNALSPYSFSELNDKLKVEFSKLDAEYYSPYTPNGKPIVNSYVLSALNITGITFLPTGEANLNTIIPPSYAVFTLAHELAHTKGVQREGDANIVAQYVLLSSDDDYLRYCGYYKGFFDLVNAVSLAGDKKSANELYGKVYSKVYDERRAEREYWAQQPQLIKKIGEAFNNLYLMFNGAENGTDSYSDGNKTDTVTPTDPETGEPEKNPETGDPVIIPIYSTVQKMFFYIYETRTGAQAKGLATAEGCATLGVHIDSAKR